MAKNIVTLDLDNTSYELRPYGVCSTAAGTAAKTVSASDFNLCTGATVLVQFDNTNTAINPTLNVNGTGAKTIKGFNSDVNVLEKSIVHEFRYDGSNWVLISNSNSKPFSTKRDFNNGTLIKTNIDYSKTSGDPFYGEIKGNTYSDVGVCDTRIQGCIYNDTIINYAVYHLGAMRLSPITAMNIDGYLCFWFPRIAYWHGYSICITTGYNYSVNRVTEVLDVSKPDGIKVVEFEPENSDNHTVSVLTSKTPATANVLGGIKIGYTQSGQNYPVQLDSTKKAYVNVPWVNNDTKNTAGSTNSTSKLYLIGATSQDANPQTYSNSAVYATNGELTASKFIGALSSNPLRLTTADTQYKDGALRYYLATSSMKTSKPMGDGYILHCGWDNTGYNSQLYIPQGMKDKNIQYRSNSGGATTWGDWVNVLDSNNYASYTVKKDGTGATGTWGINVSGSSKALSPLTVQSGDVFSRTHTNTIKYDYTIPNTYDSIKNIATGYNNTILTIPRYANSEKYNSYLLFTGNGMYLSSRNNDTNWNWVKIIKETDTVTTSAAGLMSATDKSKLDAVDSTYLKLTGGQISSSATTPLSINSTSGTESGLRFDINKVFSGWIGYNSTDGIHLFSYKGGNKILGIKDDGTPHFSGNTLLHGANYTNYTVKKDGTGATGTWPISITGNAASATNTEKLGNVSASSYALKTDIPVYKKAITTGFIDAFRTQAFGSTGSTNGSISVIRCDTAGVDKAPQSGTGLAIAKGDTHTYLYADYASGLVYIGAGNQDKLNWVKRVQFTDGTAASGTWPISVTGNAATATTATKSNNIAGGAQGSIPYQTAANTTAFLAKGTGGFTLRLNSQGTAPVWVSPYATSSTAGGFILGTTVTADAQNTARKYEVKLESSGHAYVNIPWTNTTYGHATTSAAGLMSTADKTKLDGIATGANNYTHPTEGANTGSFGPSANVTPSHGGTFNVPYITVNNKGHVTAASTKTITLPAQYSPTISVNGNAGLVSVGGDGVAEVGQHFDFHTPADTSDYVARISARTATDTVPAGLTLSGTTVGTFKGNLTGNASTSSLSDGLRTPGDQRAVATVEGDYANKIKFQGLKQNSVMGITGGGTYSYVVGLMGWSDNSGGSAHEFAFDTYANIRHRVSAPDKTWNAWHQILTTRMEATQAEIESLF